MDSSSTFLFEVVFRDIPVLGETQGLPANDRSVIVEVDPDAAAHSRTNQLPGEAARQNAEELAPEFAMQVVQKDLPHGFRPLYSVTKIDRLPGEFHLHIPKFQGNRFRAWML